MDLFEDNDTLPAINPFEDDDLDDLFDDDDLFECDCDLCNGDRWSDADIDNEEGGW